MKTRYKKIFISISAIFLLLSAANYRTDFFEIAKQIEIFTTLFKELNMNYVDETNPADLMNTAIKSMLADLDPYTQFYNEQEVETSLINNATNNTGIGAKLVTLKNKLLLVEIYKDYPADKAGLKAGDEIIKMDGIAIDNYKEDANNLLKGAAGSEVAITYLRQGKTNTTKLKRTSVEINSVPFYSMIDDNTGYIVLREFDENASKNVYSALKALKNQGAKQLILDLRGNPGGLLSEAVNITNLFIPKGKLVVTTKSKIKKYNKPYYTQREVAEPSMPLVVLINDKSASASEIVSGALQDLDRAVVVGNRSFGKGLVQLPKPLSYGTQMKITISRYYTPSGRCIQALDYWNKDENGKATRIKQTDYNAFKTTNGRTVYDGGGVQPDVEIEQAKTTSITKAIEDENLIFNFATDYYYKNNPTNLNSFKLTDKDFADFTNYLQKQGFNFETKTEKALNEALEVAKEEALYAAINKPYNELLEVLKNKKTAAIENNKTKLKNLLTDEIIKRYFYSEGLYKYYTSNDMVVTEALKIINNPTNYQKILSK